MAHAKKRKLRNISGETLYPQVAGRLVRVEHGAVVESSDDVYWQVGDTGETKLWEDITSNRSPSRTPRIADSEGK